MSEKKTEGGNGGKKQGPGNGQRKWDPSFNEWMVLVRVPDTRRVVQIARQADRGIRNLRNGLLTRYPSEEVVPLLEDFESATRALSAATEKICKQVGMPYKSPRWLDDPSTAPVVSAEPNADKPVKA